MVIIYIKLVFYLLFFFIKKSFFWIWIPGLYTGPVQNKPKTCVRTISSVISQQQTLFKAIVNNSFKQSWINKTDFEQYHQKISPARRGD